MGMPVTGHHAWGHAYKHDILIYIQHILLEKKDSIL
jgi:hypothetical protein